eukprot:jgi/Psemu1/6946/gm1.6946_g
MVEHICTPAVLGTTTDTQRTRNSPASSLSGSEPTNTNGNQIDTTNSTSINSNAIQDTKERTDKNIKNYIMVYVKEQTFRKMKFPIMTEQDKKSLENGVYVFKHDVKPRMKVKLEQTALHVMKHMQQSLIHMTRFIDCKMTVMKEVVERTSLNTIRQHATAFSIGCNYHSPRHVDEGMYYRGLTVMAPANVCSDKVIYYFVFPMYQVKIPLRSGDTLQFNTSVYQSSLNPKFDGCYINLAYVSQKTVLRSHPL